MTLDDTVAKSIHDYPTLFKDTNWEKSRIKVLDHLFFTAGNGYHWFDGYLATCFEKDPKSECGVKKVDIKKYGKVTFSWRPTQAWFDKKVYRDMLEGLSPKAKKFIKKEIKENPKFKDLGLMEDRSIYEPSPFPLSEYSLVFQTQKNVKPDWLAGAIETMEWGLNYWDQPTPKVEKSSYIKALDLKKKAVVVEVNRQTDLINKALKHLQSFL